MKLQKPQYHWDSLEDKVCREICRWVSEEPSWEPPYEEVRAAGLAVWSWVVIWVQQQPHWVMRNSELGWPF